MHTFLTLVALAGLAIVASWAARLARRLDALDVNLRNLEALVSRIEAKNSRSNGEPTSKNGPAPFTPPATSSPPQSASATPPTTTPSGPAPAQPSSVKAAAVSGSDPSVASPPSGPPSVPPVTSGTTPPSPPPPSGGASLEERLGTRWAVYIGGAALALGGVFLVKHAIDMGLLGPAARIVLGLLLGLALVVAGVRMRLFDVPAPTLSAISADIPSVLTASGTVVLFATIYAAFALYAFLDATQAFVLLAVVALATMYAAAIHGPSLAGLGLAASYLTPLLVATDQPAPWPLVIYLAVVSLAALKLARMRAWPWLTTLSMIGIGLWTLLMISGAGATAALWDLPLMVHVIAQSVIAAYVTAIEPQLRLRATPDRPDSEANTVLSVVTALTVLTLLAVPFAHWFHLPFTWAMIALLVTTAYVAPATAPAYLYAGLVAAFALLFWPGISDPIAPRYVFGDPASLIRLPENLASFIVFGLISSAGVAGPAAESLWRRRDLPATIVALAALAATAPPLVILIVEYLRITQFTTALTFSAAGVVLALLFTLAADQFQRRETAERGEAARIPTGAFAAAAIAALCVALVATLERGYLTVAFALAALGTSYVATRKDIPVLRVVVVALGIIVLGRILWDPLIMGAGVGTTPVFNWLLVGYGVPALAFAAASHFLRQRADDTASRICDALAVLFTALLGVFQIRHFVNGGNPLAFSTGHLEMGLLAVLSLGLSFALWRLRLLRANPVFEVAQAAASTFSLLFAGFGLLLFVNPAFNGDPVHGTRLLNTLLPAYLLPGLLALFIARRTMGHPPPIYSIGAATLALVLIFTYITLEVRFTYHGAYMGMLRGISDAEMWSYTAAWLVLAIIWLAYGLLRGSLPARAASGLLLALTIAKVALFDLSGVTGVWRALSFICLGAVLIAIGLIYQRFVFARPVQKPA